MGSGTDALELVLAGARRRPGDEVITPAFSFVASATAVLHLGAQPVFVDVDPATLTLDPDRVAAAITPRTRAIVAVHLYGLPAAMAALRALAERHGLALVEDAAQAFGATLDGRAVGGFGRAAAFSFYPTKPLGACGDAGPRHHPRRRRWPPPCDATATTGRRRSTTTSSWGGPAGWTSCRPRSCASSSATCPAWTEARRRIAARYTAGLAGLPLGLPARAARRPARLPPVHDPHAPA